jgi:hypothetical protein
VVELLLTLLVLYVLQSVVLLPRGATLFLRPGARWRAREGPGWTLLHLWPSTAGLLGSRAPLRTVSGGLLTRGPTPWLGADFVDDTGVRIVPGSGQQVTVRGHRVRVDGVTAFRAPTTRYARRTAELLRAVVAEGSDAEALLDEWSDRAFAVEELTAVRERVASGTRWLGIASNAYLAAVFLVTPALTAWFGGERVLSYGWPGYLLLHIVTWLLLFRAHAAVDDASADRFEVLFTAAIYPPLLVRAASELQDFLRAELAHAEGPREHAAIWQVVARLGSNPEALFAPPERSDALARSYCPTCHTEYRLETGDCIDCGAALKPLEQEAPAGESLRDICTGA